MYYHCILYNLFDRCAHTFISSNFFSGSKCVFHRQGTRLLGGRKKDDPYVVVTDVPSFTDGASATG